jgi:hypothetical protein
MSVSDHLPANSTSVTTGNPVSPAVDPPNVDPPIVDPVARRLNELRGLEIHQAINERREKAGVAALPPQEKDFNLVGLALSGGGIRSAVYNLGFLQALSHRGLLRHVDYLCSVSGGGYIGGHLAALADNLGDKNEQKRDAAIATGVQPPPLASFHDDKVHEQSKSYVADLGVNSRGQLQPEYRFRHVGEYLFADPFQFVWRYIACTLPMLLLAVSSMGLVATLVALAWRSLDSFYARDLASWSGLQDLGLGGEFVQAFLPCFFPVVGFTVGVFVYWIGSCRRSSAWRRWGAQCAKWSVIVGFIFLACSLAVFLGNGESTVWFDTSESKIQSLTWPLLALTVLFLVPMVRFRSVVNSAREGAPEWQAVAAKFVIIGACTCTPFFLVHWMSRENISGWVTHRDPDFEREDITQWPEYVMWRESLGTDGIAEYNKQRLSKIILQIRALDHLENGVWDEQTADRHSKLRNFERLGWSGRIAELVRYVSRNDSQLDQWFQKTNELRQWKSEETKDFSDHVLGTDQLTMLLHEELYDVVAKEQVADKRDGRNLKGNRAEIVTLDKDGNSPSKRDLTNEELKKFVSERAAKLTKPEQDRFWKFWERARSFELDQHASLGQLKERGWLPIEIKQFNRLLLEVLHPEFVRQRAMVSTQIVPWPDQVERARWLYFWFGALAISCVLVDFNRTSPFYIYYRDRLHRWFLRMPVVKKSGEVAQDPDHHDSTLLKHLTPWRTGAPYPLFLASLHLFNRISPQSGDQQKDAADAESCLPLLFSPLQCGSSYTRYVDTKEFCQGEVSVADAVAISGAAVTPFMTKNSGLLAMMAALNLRIGKWLPRPDCPRASNKPSMFPLSVVREFWKSLRPNYRDTWEFALAADGGFHEFFGLEELLLRRCRLIIISDAGCNNGKFEFGALADTIRLVRERHGIEFLDLDHDQPVDLHRLKRHAESLRQDQHHICMRVRYPDEFPVKGPREALVVYAQMSLTGDEELDLQQFHKVNPNFPDEPTTNQSYDENQVESFRQLGQHVGSKVCQRAPLWARKRNVETKSDNAIERWMDWLRWGYIADCGRADKLPKNRLRHIDPRSEGSELDPGRRTLLRGLLPTGRQAFKDYLRDPHVREESLKRVSVLLRTNATPRDKGASTETFVENLVKSILACHDLRADFHCSDRRDLFVVGGRRHLIRAAILAAVGHDSLSDVDLGTKPATDVSMIDKPCDLAADFFWQLNRGVFRKGNSRTAALAALCLLQELIPTGRRKEWAEPLDCADALVSLAKRAKLWRAKQLIRSWYGGPPTELDSPPVAVAVQPPPNDPDEPPQGKRRTR